MNLLRDKLVSLIFAAFSGLIIITSFTYLDKPRMIYFPLLFGSLTFVCTIIYIVKGSPAKPFETDRTKPSAQANQYSVGDDESKGTTENIMAIRLFAWLGGFILLAAYINYLILVPLFVLLILKFESRTPWMLSVFTAVGSELFTYLLFYLALVLEEE